jgi:hypothetical protein
VCHVCHHSKRCNSLHNAPVQDKVTVNTRHVSKDEFWKPVDESPIVHGPQFNEAGGAPPNVPPPALSVESEGPAWATCTLCGTHPKMLFGDCREVAILRTCKDLLTEKKHTLLPVTFPSGRKVAPLIYPMSLDCRCGEVEEGGEVFFDATKPQKQAKIIKDKGNPSERDGRDLLRRWSGFMPTVTDPQTGKTEEVKANRPLTTIKEFRVRPLSVVLVFERVNTKTIKTLVYFQKYSPI